MPQPALTKRDVIESVRFVEQLLREGHKPPTGRGGQGNVIYLAGLEMEKRGLAPIGSGSQWVRRRIRLAENLECGPDWTIKPKPKKAKKPAKAARATVAAQIVANGPRWPGMERGRTFRVCVIPDAHNSPHVNPERFAWIGRWIAEEAPDDVVCLGDFDSWDSVSGHAPPGTISFEKLPRIAADFEANARALDLLKSSMGAWNGRQHVTKGNHEFRLDRFEDRNPQMQGMLVARLDDAWEARGWRVYPFREYAMIGGVGFIHIPINAGGKPYGGKMSAHAIARDALFSIVHGHTHVRQSTHVAKLGQSKLVSVISPGCALPQGYVEDYAAHNATGWWWGVSCLTVRDGVIIDESHISMETLERRFRVRKRVKGHAR